jgi:hypothetical protein
MTIEFSIYKGQVADGSLTWALGELRFYIQVGGYGSVKTLQ